MKVRSHEVIVMGGGPAGLATAIVLARRGTNVAIYERSNADHDRLGESLTPHVAAQLRHLGVSIAHLTTLPTSGVLSWWETESPIANDFLFSPDGHGYHVDRRVLDLALADAASAAGVHVHLGQEILRCQSDEDQWHIQTRNEQLTCHWLVDATGRSGKLPVSRYRMDKLVAVVAHLANYTHPDRRLAIETTSSGWWYVAPLPGQHGIAARLTDVDLLPTDPVVRLAEWCEELRATQLIAPRVAGTTISRTRTMLAGLSVAQNIVGERWLLVGDAALAHDPLSGRGVLAALEYGQLAGEAIARALRGDDSGLLQYRNLMADYLQNHTQTRRELYDRVRRWPNAPFWLRRRRSLTSINVD